MSLLLVFLCVIAVLFVAVSASETPTLVKSLAAKRREDVQQGKRAIPQANHELIFAVKQLNLDKLEKEVIERATPGSPMYQKWLTFDEVGAMITNEPAFQKISEFLAGIPGATISKVTARKEYITVTAPISSWEAALKTEFFEWHDHAKLDASGKPEVFVRSTSYTIPDSLGSHLDHIFNTVQVPPRLNKRPTRNDQHAHKDKHNLQGSCSPLEGYTEATPAFLNNLYGISSNAGSPSYKQAVFETASESFSPSDLAQFQATYGLPTQSCLAPYGFSTSTCGAPNNNYNVDCYEGNLDVQYIMAIAQQTETVYYYVTSQTSTDPFVLFVTDLANSPHPPQVNSISWGENEYYVDPSTSSSFNTEAMKLGAIGVTVTVSSGDNGAPSTVPLTNGQTICGCPGLVTGIDGYTASFPATSPYVTAVGATQGPTCNNGPEVVCSSLDGGLITSGGGFSDIFSAPIWQTTAVNHYFDTVFTPPVSGYNRYGRGYPDVAMLGVDYPVVVQGTTQVLYGTSASSPLFAAMITLVNTKRLEKGLGPVGFINPSLYSVSSSLFTDVTSGNNNCCSGNGNPTCCSTGFTATTGWDPATGFGSLTFNNLYKALSNISSEPLPDDRLGDDYDDNSSSSSSPATFGISTGAIIGIVVAVLIAVAIALRFFRVFLLCNAAKSTSSSTIDTGTANPMSNQMVQQSGSRVDI